jgi:hypothetical protein
MNLKRWQSYVSGFCYVWLSPNPDGLSSTYYWLILIIPVNLTILIMQKDHRESITKTISEYREAIFDAMLDKHYTHAALYMKCMIACIPSELKLEAIEAPEANQIPNENATDYAKRLFKWIDTTLPAIERKIADAI